MALAFDRVTRLYGWTAPRLARWVPIPLRLIVGYGFMAHGYAKLTNGPERFIGILRALGVPVPGVMGWATIAVELLGGAAVLAGAFLPLVSLPMAAVMLTTMFTVHLPYGFSSIKLRAVTPAGPQFGPPGKGARSKGVRSRFLDPMSWACYLWPSCRVERAAARAGWSTT